MPDTLTPSVVAGASPHDSFSARVNCGAGTQFDPPQTLAALEAVLDGRELESGPIVFRQLPA